MVEVRTDDADAAQLGEVFARSHHRGDALRQRLDHARGLAIGAHAERIGALDVQQIGGLIEHRRDLGVVDRHRRRPFGPRP